MTDKQETIVAPMPSTGKYTVILDDRRRGGHVFVETTWDGLQEMLATARSSGQTYGTIPVVNDQGEVIEVEIGQC